MGKDLDTGQIIAETFKLLFANLGTYSAIGLLVLSPVIALSLYIYVSPPSVATAGVVTIGLSLLQVVTGQLVTAAITYGVFSRLSGKSTSLGECLRVATGRLLPVIGVGVLSGIAIFVGTLMLFIPGMILMTVLFVVIPVTVVERASVGEAFRRSAFLTAGQRWRIFFVVLFLTVLGFALGFVAGNAAAGLGIAGQLIILAVVVFSTILQATSYSLVYYRLRESKENIGLEQIAETFA